MRAVICWQQHGEYIARIKRHYNEQRPLQQHAKAADRAGVADLGRSAMRRYGVREGAQGPAAKLQRCCMLWESI